MQFLSRVREFNRFNSSSWEVNLLKILKCFKGSSEIWAEVHRTEWGSYENFEAAFRNKYWSEEGQEILRSRIMGTGNFGGHNNNITIYVMRIFNEAKYLEPPLLFRSFVRHISKHLPREVQITLMTREVADINELENILDVFQNIRDREVDQSSMNSSIHYTPQRGSPQGHAYSKQENHSRDGEWKCTGCLGENYVGRDFCFRCRETKAKSARQKYVVE